MQLFRVVVQVHDRDVDNLFFRGIWGETKQCMRRIDYPSDIACTKIVGRGCAVLHQIVSGCRLGLDRSI